MARQITRKQFVQGSMVAAVVVASGCSADDGEEGSEESEGGGDCGSGADGTITGNHGHTASVPAADITAAAAKDYEIMGSSPHSHTIAISAADMGTLAGGSSVTVMSSTTDGHSHNVTLAC